MSEEPIRDDTPSHFGRAEQIRALPASLESEQGALCSFLLNPREVGALCAQRKLRPAHFHVPAHATIYALITDMWTSGKPIDIVTVTQELHAKSLLETCGGGAMIANLFSLLPTAMNVEYYIDTLEEMWTLREVIRHCGSIAKRAYVEQDNVAGLVSEIIDLPGKVRTQERRAAPTMRELVMDKIRRMEDREAVKGLLPTGIAKLDQLSPFARKTLALICGQQKAGKTMLANSIEAHLLQEGHRGLHFTLEDPAAHTIDRLFANMSRVPIVRQHQDGMGEVDFQNVSIAASKMQEWPFTIRDDVFDLSEMLAVMEMEKARHPDLAFVVVDYAQLVRAQVGKNETREREVAKVSRALRLASMRLDVGMLVLSQINADGIARESQALEQDCTAKWLVEMTDETNVRTVKVPIQRNGGSRLRFKLTFLGHLARFENYAGRDDEEEAAAPERTARKSKAWKGYQ